MNGGHGDAGRETRRVISGLAAGTALGHGAAACGRGSGEQPWS